MKRLSITARRKVLNELLNFSVRHIIKIFLAKSVRSIKRYKSICEISKNQKNKKTNLGNASNCQSNTLNKKILLKFVLSETIIKTFLLCFLFKLLKPMPWVVSRNPEHVYVRFLPFRNLRV